MKCHLCRMRQARPGLRVCNRCCLEEDGLDSDCEVSTSRMSPEAKSKLMIHWIHLHLE